MFCVYFNFKINTKHLSGHFILVETNFGNVIIWGRRGGGVRVESELLQAKIKAEVMLQ